MHTPARTSSESSRQPSLSGTAQTARTDQRADMNDLKTLSATMGTSQLQQDLQARQALMDAGTVQRVARYEHAGGDRIATVYQKLLEHAETEGITKLSLDNVRGALEEIEGSPIDYGAYDLSDEFHLAQLYFDIDKRLAGNNKARESTKTIAKQEEEAVALHNKQHKPLETLVEESPELEGHTLYDTAYLGAGASVAYAIVSQGAQFDRADDVVIGDLQPWAGARGPGVVAHPEHMISPIRHFLGKDAIDDEWLNRDNFSKLIAEVLGRVKMGVVPHKVLSIAKKDYGYLITAADGKEYRSRKVISGIGVGEHRIPDGVKDANRVAQSDAEVGTRRVAHSGADLGVLKIMNMDVFTKIAHRLRKSKPHGILEVAPIGTAVTTEERAAITIVLSGANGGIDVAFDALNRGFKVQWIVGNGGATFLAGFPNYAAYLPYLRALERTNELGKINVGDFGVEVDRVQKLLPSLYKDQDKNIFGNVIKTFEDARFEGVHFGRMGAVTETSDGVSAAIDRKPAVAGDLLVFAQGQGDGNFELFKNLPPLVPERDHNHRFTEGGNAVLGLSSEDGSLKVIGAMAYRMAATLDVRHVKMLEILGALDVEMLAILQQGIPHGAFLAAYQRYGELALAVAKAQSEAKTLKEKEEAKAPQKELDTASLISRDATAARNRALTAFEKAMLPVNEQFAVQRRAVLAPEKRTFVNHLQDLFADAVANSGSVGAAMRPVIDSLPKDVLLNDQLTPSRSQVEATSDYVPFNIGKKSDFITDDRTAVAIHISTRYPALSDFKPPVVEELAACIVNGRKAKVTGDVGPALHRITPPDFTPEPPNGRRYQEYWEAKLAGLENYFRSTGKK